MDERKGVYGYEGSRETLVGPEIKVGQRAPDFKALDINMQEVTLSQTRGKIRLLTSFLSVDAAQCDILDQLFENETAYFPNVVIYAVTMDLPFTQARYSEEHNLKHVKMLSDHRDAFFGRSYGVLIKELRLLSGAVFVVDADEMIRHVEYSGGVAQLPDYSTALKVLKATAQECSRD